MNKKKRVLTRLFEICKDRNDFIFDNDLVKDVCRQFDFKNPFDVTKIDNRETLPKVLLDSDYFVLHLGLGKHIFLKGIKKGYHDFEPIPHEKFIDWEYQKSILNELNSSESNILSVAVNHKIIQHFLYKDINANANVYHARRTKTDLSYTVGNKRIRARSVQSEMDLTMEYNGLVTVFECKNGFPSNFAIYQIYHPFLYYYNMKIQEKIPIKEITCCYILRKNINNTSVLRLYNYTFTQPGGMASIKLLSNAQYKLIKRRTFNGQ